MAYSVKIYCYDESIKSVSLSTESGIVLWNGKYGDAYNSDDYGTQFDIPLVFRAIPEDGYEFSAWEYYLGSDATPYTVEDNPFLYEEGEDIEITAISEEPPFSYWELTENKWGFIDDWISFVPYVRENYLFCYRVVFCSSGEAYFYTENSDSSVVGWVSTTNEYNEKTGIPYDYIEESTSDGVVDMYCDVEAGVPYYVWIRGQNMWQSEAVFLNIEPPPVVRPNYFEWYPPKVQYGEYNLTAKEWNAFTKNINEVRAYNYVENYEFDVAYPLYVFTADMYNQAREAIEEITGSLGDDALVAVSGEPVTAYMLNYIVDDVLNTLKNI